MPTIEERLQALEQENAARKQEIATHKKTEELLTIAVRALVSKEAFEKLQDTVEKTQETVKISHEQNGKLFDVLNTHNVFTNERLGDIQNQLIELDGKIVGQQTEIRQRFTEQDGKIVGLRTETRQHFTQIEAALAQILARLPEK